MKKYLLIDCVDGTQVQLTDEEAIWGPVLDGGRLQRGQRRKMENLEEVAALLSYPGAWVTHETQCRYEPEEEWQGAGKWHPATQVIYGRGVIGTMIVRQEAELGS